MQAAYNVTFPVGMTFPMGIVDNLFTTEFTTEEDLQALSARLRAMVTEAIRHGATMALAGTQV